MHSLGKLTNQAMMKVGCSKNLVLYFFYRGIKRSIVDLLKLCYNNSNIYDNNILNENLYSNLFVIFIELTSVSFLEAGLNGLI